VVAARKKGLVNDAIDGTRAERRRSEKEKRVIYDPQGKLEWNSMELKTFR
jgi:hypothetical protein